MSADGDLFDIYTQNRLKDLHFGVGKAVESLSDEISGVLKSLQKIGFRSLQPAADLLKIFGPVKFPDNSGTEFIGNRPVEEKGGALFYFTGIVIRCV